MLVCLASATNEIDSTCVRGVLSLKASYLGTNVSSGRVVVQDVKYEYVDDSIDIIF